MKERFLNIKDEFMDDNLSLQTKIDCLNSLLNSSENIVVFTGMGIL